MNVHMHNMKIKWLHILCVQIWHFLESVLKTLCIEGKLVKDLRIIGEMVKIHFHKMNV